MLKGAIAGNYCAYPAMDSETFFEELRRNPRFAAVRSSAIVCQNKFSAERTTN